MNGVMIPVVSAGSNHPGASEMCTAHVSSPAGACERAFVGTISPRSRSMARISAERETRRSGTRSVMRILLCIAKVWERSRGPTNGTRSAADYPREADLVNPEIPRDAASCPSGDGVGFHIADVNDWCHH